MARMPADKALTKRHPVSRQAIWDALRARPNGCTLADLEKATRIHRRTIRSFIDALCAGKFVEAEFAIPASLAKLHLVRDVGHEAPRLRPDGTEVTSGASREQMWRTMKIVGTFSSVDLAAQASLPESPVSEVDAKDYCKRLARAGYLAVVEKGKAGKGGKGGKPTVYRFVKARNTGPRPPMIQKLDSVFDPNTRMVVWQAEPRA